MAKSTTSHRQGKKYGPTSNDRRKLPTPLDSREHTSATKEEHIPTSLAAAHHVRAPYTPLTPQSLKEYTIHQASSSHDIDPKHNINPHSLGTNLSSALQTKINGEPVGMAPMARFQLSTSDPLSFNAYQQKMWLVDGAAVTSAFSQEHTYGESSIMANHGDENGMYSQGTSVDPVVFAPEHKCTTPSSIYRSGLWNQETELAGVGRQFESYSY